MILQSTISSISDYGFKKIIKDNNGTIAVVTTNIIKEEVERTSVERTFIFVDGGYKKDNVYFDTKGHIASPYKPKVLEINNTKTVNVDKYITKVENK